MNKFLSLILVGAIAFAITSAPKAVDTVLVSRGPVDTFSGVGTGTTTLSYFVASAIYGKPRLQYINATSDKAGSVIKFYTAAAPVQVNIATNATQAVVWVTNTFSGSDVVVLHNVSGDAYQRLVVSSATTSNVTFTANITNASAVGDQLFKVTAAGTIPVGAATKELNAAGGTIYSGQSAKPLLFEIDGTSACSVNACSGYYDR